MRPPSSYHLPHDGSEGTSSSKRKMERDIDRMFPARRGERKGSTRTDQCRTIRDSHVLLRLHSCPLDTPLTNANPRPDYVFGGHVTPEKAGTVSLTRGVAYSQFDSWKITMNGISGHGLRPETTVDPITMACYAVHPPSNRRLASRALARSRCPHSRANLAAQPRTSYPDLHSSR